MSLSYERQLEVREVGKRICTLLEGTLGESKKLNFAAEFFEANEFGLAMDFVSELAAELPKNAEVETELARLKTLLS
jgi:hypothetical protein